MNKHEAAGVQLLLNRNDGLRQNLALKMGARHLACRSCAAGAMRAAPPDLRCAICRGVAAREGEHATIWKAGVLVSARCSRGRLEALRACRTGWPSADGLCAAVENAGHESPWNASAEPFRRLTARPGQERCCVARGRTRPQRMHRGAPAREWINWSTDPAAGRDDAVGRRRTRIRRAARTERYHRCRCRRLWHSFRIRESPARQRPGHGLRPLVASNTLRTAKSTAPAEEMP